MLIFTRLIRRQTSPARQPAPVARYLGGVEWQSSRPPPRARPAAHAAALGAAVAVFFLQAPSYVYHPRDHLADAGDAVLNAWILGWDARAFADPAVNVWDAPICHPAKNTLAFSEALFGNLWVTLPVQYLTGNHVLAANVLVFVSFVLGAYFTFLLVRQLTGNATAGAVAGILFSFNPLRWSEVHHIQLLPFFWAPLAMLLTQQFLESRRTFPLLGLILTVLIQTYASIYLGIILVLTLSVYGCIFLLTECRRAKRWRLLCDWRLAAAVAVGILALLPLALPYVRAAADWDFGRSESENSSFSVEPLGLLVPPTAFRSYRGVQALVAGRVRGAYGLGLLPWALAAAGLALGRRLGPNAVRRRFAWTACVMAVFMLGPYLIWLGHKTSAPLPHLLVYHLFPGAKAMRVPARFVFSLLLCLAVLAGYAAAYLLAAAKRWRPAWRVVSALVLAGVFAVDYAVADEPGAFLETRDHFPQVYDYLARSVTGRPVLELPAEIRGQFRYLHYQTAHGRPLVGGDTGCYTPAILELAERTRGLPTEDVSRFLRLTPAETLVIHLDRYPPEVSAAWERAELDRFGFASAGRFGSALVWERREPPPAISSHLEIARPRAERCPGRWRNGWQVVATVTPAEPGLPWRFLDGRAIEVEISLVAPDGREHRYNRRVEVPPYLLPGDMAALKTGRLSGGPDQVIGVRFRGSRVRQANEEEKTDASAIGRAVD
jgi:hypothetical protein